MSRSPENQTEPIGAPDAVADRSRGGIEGGRGRRRSTNDLAARTLGRSLAAAGAMVAGAEGEPGADAKKNAALGAIMEATVACFSEFGWRGTNMSVIARRSGVSRGGIQHYFPTLDALLRAAIRHLFQEGRTRCFSVVIQGVFRSAAARAGMGAFGDTAEDPLYRARRELEATARTDPQLARILAQASAEGDDAAFHWAKQAYPELGRHGDATLARARDFTLVVLEGLSTYRFGREPERRRAELIGLLQDFLVAYWAKFGVDPLDRPPRAEI